jgi:hypothetical protein
MHYANFAVWIGATLHGIGSGTDQNAVWLLAVYATAAAAVAGAIAWRFVRVRPLAAAAALGVGAAVVGLAAGPLHAGRHPWNAATFSGSIQASTFRLSGGSRRYYTYMVTGVGGGGQQVWFRADVLIRMPFALRGSSFEMAYLPSGLRCRGTVTRLGESDLTAACRLRTGARRRVDLSWRSIPDSELFDGTISARPLTRRATRGS